MVQVNSFSEQFHQMTKDEFESLPGTFFHSDPAGNFNWDTEGRQGFHVGTRRAAEEAVINRVNKDTGDVVYGDGSIGWSPFRPIETSRNIRIGDKLVNIPERKPHPDIVRGGRIVSPMVNSINNLGVYGRGTPGELDGSGDSRANATVNMIKSRGQTMRKGIYYMNVVEDPGSVSAVLPNRQSFKTHEDYLVEAMSKGLRIPKTVLSGYDEAIGQQKLTFSRSRY